MYTHLARLVPLAFVPMLLAQAPSRDGAPGHPVLPEAARSAIADTPGLWPDGPGRLRAGGRAYRAGFSPAGLEFEPALGSAVAETQRLALRPISVRRGGVDVLDATRRPAPLSDGRTVRFAHAAAAVERYDVRADGVALSWRFAEPVPGEGDLVVRYAVDTSLPAASRTADGGLSFALPGVGGVSIGGVTGIDADGAEAAGEIRCDGGFVELSLPAAFVERARYPLVLDPVIGPIVTVTPTANIARDADVAFDATSGLFLVVYHLPISGSDADVRAQRCNASGQPVGPSILLPATGIASPARIANLPSRDRFGVVWTQQNGFVHSVEFVALNAGNGSVTHTRTIKSALGASLFRDVDIGADSTAPAGAFRGFVIVWEDEVTDAIEVERITFDALDQIVSGPSTAWSNAGAPLFTSYGQPAIARVCGDDTRLLIVARRSNILTTSTIVAGVVRSNSFAFSPTVTVASSGTAALSRPAVSGRDGKWLVAWEEEDQGTSASSIAWRPVQLDSAGTGLTLGTTRTAGSQLTPASAPTLAYTPGRSWLAYRFRSFLPAATTVRAVGVDSQSGEPCNDVFSTTVSGTPEARVTVATMTSGGLTSGEDALCVFDEGGKIYGQLLRNHGAGGGYANLGGGCGQGGAVAFSHPPGIGSSGLVCSLSGLSATALIAIFNLNEGASTLPCGPCSWLPFSVTRAVPVAGSSASVEFPIPCMSSLVGAQFDVQWTTIDFPQAPCPTFPGLVLSDRMRMTLGP